MKVVQLIEKVIQFQWDWREKELKVFFFPSIYSVEAAQLTALTTTVTLNYKAARSVLTDASDRFLSRLSMLLWGWLCFFGVGSEVNKWQNRQSQSWFGPPDTALHRHVLQLEPYDASLWLFSVNSALSRPSILLCCLMLQQSLPSQLPSPHLPLQFIYCASQVHRWFLRSQRGNSSLLHKTISTFVSFLSFLGISFCVVWGREMWHPIVPCSPPTILSWFHARRLQHMVDRIPNADQPLSSPLWLLFLLLIHPTCDDEDCTMARWCVA